MTPLTLFSNKKHLDGAGNASGRKRIWKETHLEGNASERNASEGTASGRKRVWKETRLEGNASGRKCAWKEMRLEGNAPGRKRAWKVRREEGKASGSVRQSFKASFWQDQMFAEERKAN